jgi:adhesin/invasin
LDQTVGLFVLSNAAGGAASIMVSTGNAQSATVGAAFGMPLRATVLDTNGNPVTGVSVAFAAPASGASGSFAGSVSVTTNSNGIAIAPPFTANSAAGSYTVTATASGVAIPASFSLTNSPGPATTLSLGAYPTSVVAGASYSLTVTARDAGGNVAPTYTGAIHFTSNDAAASLPINYTFTANDAGVHTFSMTLRTVGTGRSVTATDMASSAITGTASGIAVTPAVLSVSPINGPQAGGGTVTITGIGFTTPLSVTIGGAACTNVQVNGAGTMITCTAPVNHAAGTVDVVVTTPNGVATLANGYTFLPGAVGAVPGGRAGSGGGGSSGNGNGGSAPAALPAGR